MCVLMSSNVVDFAWPKATGCNRDVPLCSHQCVNTLFARFHRRGWDP